MLEKYNDRIKVVHLNFPIRSHKYARSAAEAAMAAHRQGKFWLLHDALFEVYNALSEEKIVELARRVGLDMDRFERDRRSREVQEDVILDLRRAQAAGVRGTPTVFINGRLLRDRSLAGMSALIDAELKKP